jgi:benzoate transport
MSVRPGVELRDRPMSGMQISVVALCTALNVLDGFDLQSISFIAPILSSEWRLSAGMLGMLFSVGLAGIAIGAPLLAALADIYGRRRTILMCLALIAVSVSLSSISTNLLELMVLRGMTGMGIGGMLATINTMAAEFSSDRRRDLSISVTMAGFPIGGTLGGILAVYLVGKFDWRAVFVAFGAFTSIMLPIVYYWMPESLDYLAARRPKNALQRINSVRRQLRIAPLEQLAPPASRCGGGAIGALVRPPLLRGTVLIGIGFFAVPLAFYFVLSWMPKLLVDLGLSVRGGISSSVFMNMGGILGGVGYGVIAVNWGRRRVAVVAMLLAFVTAVSFGFAPLVLSLLLIGSSIVGVFMFAAFTSLYALVPGLYPPGVRASGTGLALGVGRTGALLGPYAGGLLIAAGWGSHNYLIVMMLPFLAGALAVGCLPREVDQGTLAD